MNIKHLVLGLLFLTVSQLQLSLTSGAWAADPLANPPKKFQAKNTACQALIYANNELWWLNPTKGETTLRLTSDGQGKSAISLSPDGKIIAYAGKNKDLSLIDNTGKLLSEENIGPSKSDRESFDDSSMLPSYQTIMHTQWLNSATLMTVGHISPYASNYRYFLFPVKGNLAKAITLDDKDERGNCAPNPFNLFELACIDGQYSENSAWINVGSQGIESDESGESVYATDSFASSKSLGKVEFPVGGEATVPWTRPNLIVSVATEDFKNDSNPFFHLRANEVEPPLFHRSSDDYWLSTTSGHMETLRFDDRIYGFTPIYDAVKKTLSVEITESLNSSVFEGNLAWGPLGMRLAAIEVNLKDERSLVVFNRLLPRGKNGYWKIESRQPIKMSGPITSLKLANLTTIRIENGGKGYEQKIANGVAIPSSSAKEIEVKPQWMTVKIDGKDVTAQVIDWSCK